MDKHDIIASIEGRKDSLCALSDAIWGFAETAFVEHKSMAALVEALKSEDFAVETGIGNVETAFKGTFGSGAPVIGLLGEYDALFGIDQVAGATEKVSDNPGAPGHGCGHNMLGVGALAAAFALKDYLIKTGASGTVIYFGTPGEEGGSGKAFMAREGCFDMLDAALTWHPSVTTAASTTSSLANIQARFRFSGVSSHAAGAPHMGRSALDGAELMNVGVQFMREHVTSDVRVHYSVTDGGGLSPNVVQPTAELLYLCRADTIKGAQEVYEWVCEIARGAAMMTQTKVDITFVKACSNVINNRVMEFQLQKNLEAMPPYKANEEERKLMRAFSETVDQGRESMLRGLKSTSPEAMAFMKEHLYDDFYDFVVPITLEEKASPGSTDVGDVSWVCPTAQINVATWAPLTPGHSWQVVSQGTSSMAHKGTLYAGEVMAATAIDLLEQPELLAAAKAEHAERVGPDGYQCPIPKGVVPKPLA